MPARFIHVAHLVQSSSRSDGVIPLELCASSLDLEKSLQLARVLHIQSG